MKKRKRRASKTIFPLLGAGVLLCAAGLLIGIIHAERKLAQLVVGGLGESFSTRIYAAPIALNEKTWMSPETLLKRLSRLNYKKTDSAAAPGEYSWNTPALRLNLRGFEIPSPSQHSGTYELQHSDQGLWSITSELGESVDEIYLEPEMVSEISGAKKLRREPVTFAEIPRTLQDAVVAAEDKRFFRHYGLDIRAIGRSAWQNIMPGPGLQGASTITQQLVKNLFLTPHRTWKRKVAEAALSFYLELRYDKIKILTLYLNHIYLGQEGPVGVAGVKSASRFYFGKDVKDLDLPESALLAGLIRSPYRYNPRRDIVEAKKRRDFILSRMREEGTITSAEESSAINTPVIVAALAERREDRFDTDYFVAEVMRHALTRYGEDVLFRHGLSLFTTLDTMLQSYAQKALEPISHQGALVALNQENGNVLALVGGRNFRESQFNRATQAQRQPGSAFKPFVYGAALENGMTAVTLLDDVPKTFKSSSGKSWNPQNYGSKYYGTTTLRKALALSLNSATLDLLNKIGPAKAAAFARKLGITSDIDQSLALGLGASEINLLELTAAYAPFANSGFRIAPRMIASVYDAQNTVLEYAAIERESVISPSISYLMTSLLQDVVSEGTARPLSTLGFTRPTAGKTGTTNDGRDAWFIGYTPNLLAGVWIGDDNSRAINAGGAKDALPVWWRFMQQAIEGPALPFPSPSGLVATDIDIDTGYLAKSGCPNQRKEWFIDGTQPVKECAAHSGGVFGWLKRWMHKK